MPNASNWSKQFTGVQTLQTFSVTKYSWSDRRISNRISTCSLRIILNSLLYGTAFFITFRERESHVNYWVPSCFSTGIHITPASFSWTCAIWKCQWPGVGWSWVYAWVTTQITNVSEVTWFQLTQFYKCTRSPRSDADHDSTRPNDTQFWCPFMTNNHGEVLTASYQYRW